MEAYSCCPDKVACFGGQLFLIGIKHKATFSYEEKWFIYDTAARYNKWDCKAKKMSFFCKLLGGIYAKLDLGDSCFSGGRASFGSEEW
ncbi:hypothetical protein AWM70_20775 [Paenibacillus yonginensis]|uniref:Uncharacterized protein n=1 Tax=Paenibacillus yonginensis TaxID=1462996 RepID=A0A1B1N5M1_9BACL|nr:hypothetical protein AWM70_20775 [Paenibacillus yonginensis]